MSDNVYVIEAVDEGWVEADSLAYSKETAERYRDDAKKQRTAYPMRWRIATMRTLDDHPHTELLRELRAWAQEMSREASAAADVPRIGTSEQQFHRGNRHMADGLLTWLGERFDR